MQVRFTKMQGLGNDFVLLDARATPLALAPAQLRRLGDRRYGVGCDQILLIDQATLPDATVRYRVFNNDGSPAQHCGNGVRCVAHYLALHDGRAPGDVLWVELGGRSYELKLEAPGQVRVDMGEPDFTPAALPLAPTPQAASYTVEFEGRAWTFGAVSMGNPHAVFEVPEVHTAPVAGLGAMLQDHPLFPERVNVGFMQVLDAAHVRLRVFERGAGETPACGTGACGAVAVGRAWGRLGPQVNVALTGGDLIIEWAGAGSTLWMSGPAARVFEGTIEL